MAVLTSNRVAMVAAEINKALIGAIAADAARCDATKEQRAASERAVGARETALLSLAAIAARENWTRDEIDSGTAEALRRRNSKDNSVATFAAEIKRACHPSARPHISGLARLCAETWDTEGEASKDYPRPCRKAFARRYHMLVATFSEAIKGRVFASRQEIVRWAVTCDPDRDPAKVLKRLHATRSQLRTLEAQWPHGGLATSCKALGSITLAELKAVGRWPPTKSDGGASDVLADALGELATAA